MSKDFFVRVLNTEMSLATGCTEPGAVALTAAYAAEELKKLGDTPKKISVSASINILKNAMAAGIPGTHYMGMAYAVAIGAVGGESKHQLEVISHVPPEKFKEAEALVNANAIETKQADTPKKLYIDVVIYGEKHTVRAVISDSHTNLSLTEADGKVTYQQGTAGQSSQGNSDTVPVEEIAEKLTIKSIWDYCTEQLDPMHDPIDIIRQAISVNSAICEEGMKQDYGLAIGRNLEKNCASGLMSKDFATTAMMVTAAGSDARMAGAPYSVVTNSGSGNQGITATMSVVTFARQKNVPEDKMIRAVTLSNLVTIRIKSKFGVLSNLCGATVASTGAACGIVYLLGGGFNEVCNAIHNMVGNVTGMICDGAKADCALKISTCTNAAFQAAAMAMRGTRIQSTDGVVAEDVEKTIDNFATLSNHGTSDAVILNLMLNKQH